MQRHRIALQLVHLRILLLCCRLCSSHRTPFGSGIIGFTNAAHDGLVQTVHALLLIAVHHLKTKLRFALWPLANAHGQLAAEVIFDECRLVAAFLHIPRVDAKRAEIAGLALGSAGRGDEILWLITGGIADSIEFEPGEGTQVGRGGAFTNGIRKFEFDETPNYPAGDWNGLISRLRSRIGLSRASGVFTGRTSGQSANEKPIFLFRFRRFAGGIFFLRALHPIGSCAADDLNGNTTAKMVEARRRSSGFDVKICGGFGTAARLDGHRANLVQEFDAALPQWRIHQISGVHPADSACGGTDFDVVIAASDYGHAIAVVQHPERLAHLRHPAPECHAPLADEGFAQRFVLRPEPPGKDAYEAKQRHGNEEFSLHAPSTTSTFMAFAVIPRPFRLIP